MGHTETRQSNDKPESRANLKRYGGILRGVAHIH